MSEAPKLGLVVQSPPVRRETDDTARQPRMTQEQALALARQLYGPLLERLSKG